MHSVVKAGIGYLVCSIRSILYAISSFLDIGAKNLTIQQTHRFRLLHQAISSHCLRTREAMTGQGIDRHLLGLRLLLRPLNGESSALFEDELFERSSRWKLSTSGLSAGLLFKGTGFGAVYEDGYGINCMFSFISYG